MKAKKYLLLLAVICTVLILAACGGGSGTETDSGSGSGAQEEDTSSGGESEGEDASSEELSGEVVIDGSGTVYPLMAVLSEDYMVNQQQGVSVEVSRAGTGAGFERFLNEETDFNDASRPISEEEMTTAEENGIDVQEIKLALDGLTIVTSPENDFATELTHEQVVDIFTGEITNWSEINPEWPDETINTYGPNENHGTYEFFFEDILGETALAENIDLQQEYSTLINLISQDPYGIGFVGFGYYDSNQDNLNAVSIDFGEGSVEPSLETISETGPYADYTRPVFTYMNVNRAQENPAVMDYAMYLMENVSDFAGDSGFAPIPEEEIQTQTEQLQSLESGDGTATIPSAEESGSAEGSEAESGSESEDTEQ